MTIRENVISLWERHGPSESEGLESRSSLYKFLAQNRYRVFCDARKRVRFVRVTYEESYARLLNFFPSRWTSERTVALTILPNQRRKVSPLHRAFHLPYSTFFTPSEGAAPEDSEIRNGPEIQTGQNLHTSLGSYFLNIENNRTRRQPTKTRQTMGDRTESHAFDFSCFSDRIIVFFFFFLTLTVDIVSVSQLK